MTKQEAQHLILSKPGTKITHKTFSEDEYIYINESGELRDEKGYYLPWGEFWNNRKSEPFMNDWKEKEE